MTCGITVAPRIPTASRTLSEPSKPGMKPFATCAGSGSARKTCAANATTITPMNAAITASSRRKPRACSARIANAAALVIRAAGKRGMPKRMLRPIAAPMNSARSVAIAITSAWSQSATLVLRENRSRQTSGRFIPVAIPSFALIDWTTIPIRFAMRMTQSRR